MFVSEQIFPCRRVELNEVCKNPRDLALDWIAKRSSEHWALISGTALASEIHGWVAHEVLMRNHERGNMRSNSLDGEFIRLLSGTHHVATSFKRAGLVEGDKTAYIVDLSINEHESVFESNADVMGFKILKDRPNLEIFDHIRLGINGEKTENAAIGHIHVADLR